MNALHASNEPKVKIHPFTSVDGIKGAVDKGWTVYHQSLAYQVIKDKFNQYMIKCTQNGYCIGLTWADGKTLNGKLEEFFLYE